MINQIERQVDDMKQIFLFFLLFFVFVPSKGFALQDMRSLPTDSRIRTFIYDPNEVYRYVGHYKFQSSIEFSPDEQVSTVSMGDSLAWQVSPSGNRLFIKPIEPDATTNMTVITNKRIYQFELHAEEAEDINDKEMTFSVRFSYPSEVATGNIRRFDKDFEPDIEEEPERYNFNYTFSGSNLIAPLKIFDDGEFTYFEFRDKNADIPAFFLVDGEGAESVINYHVAGKYIVVERVASQFTLRHGVDVTCIFNETSPLRRIQVPERKVFGVF